MNLRKNLKSKIAQAAVEYIAFFIVIAAGIIIIFGGFNPDSVNIKSVFNDAAIRVMDRLNNE